MFSNVLMTTLTPLCNTNETTCWQNRPFTTIWPEDQQPTSTTRPLNQPKNIEIKKTIKKKKRYRTAFSTEQLQILEKTYYRLKYINADKRKELAQDLNIGERSIKVWFQNRRMKEKRESSESSDSSAEAFGSVESPPRSVSTYTSHKEIDVCRVSPEPWSNQFHTDAKIKAEDVQVCTNQFSNYSSQDFSGYHFNGLSENQGPAGPWSMPANHFAADRSTYPTSYYPTLVDYFLGENYYYESGNVNTDTQWTANNFDLNYFQ